MNLPLHAIRLIRDTSEPLHITVERLPDDPGGTFPYRLERTGHGQVEIMGPKRPHHMTQYLEQLLAAYPHEATVNRMPIERTPVQDNAPVILRQGNGPKPPTPKDIKLLSDWHPATVPLKHRILAGGVLCQPNQGHELLGMTCYTPAGGGDHRWQFADQLTIFPIMVITSEEIEHLSKQDFAHLLSDFWLQHMASQPKNNDSLFKVISDRMRQQVQNTLTEAQLPPFHDGPIYHYVQPSSDATYPPTRTIIVNQDPLAFPADITPLTASLADALYRDPQAHVPIWHHQHSQQIEDLPPKLADQHFDPVAKQQPEKIRTTGPLTAHYCAIQWDSTITEHTAKADYAAYGTPMLPLVDIDRAAHGRPGIQETITQCYQGLQYGEPPPQWAIDELETLVIEATQGPAKAFAHQLQKMLDSFRPATVRPAKPITVRSRDRTITVTTKANPDCTGCGQPHSKCGYQGQVCALHGDCGCIECLHSPAGHLT